MLAGRPQRRDADSAASLIFGTDTYATHRHQDPAPLSARQPTQNPSAGAPLQKLAPSLAAAEMAGMRRQRAARRDEGELYDAYVSAMEESSFKKLNHSLGKLERRAEREWSAKAGAAGHRNEIRQAKSDAQRQGRCGMRAASPLRCRDSVAALLQDSRAEPRHSSPGRMRSR